MANKFEDVIRVSISAYDKGRALLPKQLGNIAVSHFKDSWRKQGFEDSFIKLWQKRKNNTDAGRATLVKSGRLRRSFTSEPTFNRVTVINDTPYGVYHNYGTKKLPQRRFMGKSQVLDEKSGVKIMRFMKTAFK